MSTWEDFSENVVVTSAGRPAGRSVRVSWRSPLTGQRTLAWVIADDTEVYAAARCWVRDCLSRTVGPVRWQDVARSVRYDWML